ncbi:hypothetical protein ACFPM0_12070 [Pseudonocardia sulfidoxydans]|uniref:hypothetical protein n=1 Tax=Pseudonocardia sulfidoxydans TaxID=54011 RepID=UPI00361156F4
MLLYDVRVRPQGRSGDTGYPPSGVRKRGAAADARGSRERVAHLPYLPHPVQPVRRARKVCGGLHRTRLGLAPPPRDV